LRTIRLTILAVIGLWWGSCTSPSTASLSSTVIKQYFLEIALGSEYGQAPLQIRKWKHPIYLAIDGEPMPEYLAAELQQVIQELNLLIEASGISLTCQTQIDAHTNLIVYLGSPQGYTQSVEPLARPFIDENKGFCYVHFNDRNEIYSGSVFLNTEAGLAEAYLKHLLREELTQALGLLQDSYTYPESIFYQKWTSTNTYAPIDKHLIRVLYAPWIRPGMTIQEVEKAWQKHFRM
jgi:hypothetical protein